jgi:hypothetical protein
MKDSDWDIRRKGRAWEDEEADQRYNLTPEKIEMIEGKLLWSDEDRVALLGLLLENVGADRAVRLGDHGVWRTAIDALVNQRVLRDGGVPWIVADVDALDNYSLHVRFLDGTEGRVEMSQLILGPNAGVFAALRDPKVFARARVDAGAVTWAGDIDLAPDAMYDEIKANGRWVLD